ncbi:MAG TPA: BTAD domain-containing putative transcriptional regulator [Nonomuraea sp.]|nr:BTAD domain-containing putative transcriptional regulator [Nonomuraea sp.]
MPALRFSVLGALTVTCDGTRLPVPGGKVRILLAALLLRPNMLVSQDQLAERLWDQRPVSNPRRVLQTNVVRLRQALNLDEVIRAESGGYRACLEPDQLDLLEFQHLTRLAADAATPAGENRLLHQALALWRGPVCADVDSDVLHQVDVPPLAEQRLHALERRIDLDIDRGKAPALVAELRRLTAEHPLRERLWLQLMTTLYRTGRQADALDAYRAVSHLLKEEFGIDPGPELRRLHQAILAQEQLPSARSHSRSRERISGDAPIRAEDARTARTARPAAAAPGAELPAPSRARDGGRPAVGEDEPELGELVRAWRERALLTQEQLAARSGLSVRTIRRLEGNDLRRPRTSSMHLVAEALDLDADELSILTRALNPAPQRPGPAPAQVVPRQLPADVGAFIGRARELAFADEVWAADTVTIATVDGMGGVGKTALAVHWAHRLADRFPDGQLYINLQGYASGPALSPMQALAVLLRALGVMADHVPTELEEAAALYRSLLAGKRVFVVLDNALSAEQVRPLLPGGDGCMVVVTSRDRLTGLVATHGARRLSLDVLDPDEAVALLTRIVGQERVAAEPSAVTALAQACGHLPLALRIAAANLSSRPEEPIAGYLAELRAGDRLEGLTVAHDPRVAVRRAFDHSYHRLASDRRRLYRLLGLVPGPEISVAGAAALADLPAEDARRALSELVDAHLVQPRGRDRYALHDLLRDYASRRAQEHDGPADCEAAVERLLEWYLHGIDAAAKLLYPWEVRLPLPPAVGAPSPPEFVDLSQASAWLEAELANLVAAVLYAADHGPHPAAWRLADALRGYLWQRRPMVEWLLIARAGLDAAAVAGEVRAQVPGHLSLGQAYRAAGRLQPARRHISAALSLARETGWADGQAAALFCRSNVAAISGELHKAADELAQALALYRRSGWLGGQADTLFDLALTETYQGRLHDAARHLTEALDLVRRLGSRLGETVVLGGMGEVDHGLGRLEAARGGLTHALRLYEELGMRFGHVYFLRALAAVNLDLGHPKEALVQATDALRLAGEMGDLSSEAKVHIVLAGIRLHLGHAQDAGDHYAHALKLARQISSRVHEAGARHGMAEVCLALDQPRQAIDCAGHALSIATVAGMRILQGHARTTLAAAHHRLGRHDQALTHVRQALELHRQSGHHLGAARALQVMGHVLRDSGDLRTAVRRWEEALELLTGIGSPKADEIRTLLDA